MTEGGDLERKPSRESEIDYLLAEEFECDPVFAERFAADCGLRFETFEVLSAIVRTTPLGGDVEIDLLVKAKLDGRLAALLIEDKITAGPAARQAERYRIHAEHMKNEGHDCVRTVLVAPRAYRGEREQYDASIDLEQVAEWLSSPEPGRLRYRREVIARALEKQQTTGVQSPDWALHELHSDYLSWVKGRCAAEGHPYEFPQLRAEYSHESWIEEIRHPEFPENVWIRHRLWTSKAVADEPGRVDLVFAHAAAATKEQVRSSASSAFGEEAVEEYGKGGHGIQVSLHVPSMTQSTGFGADAAERAFSAFMRLTEWYLETFQKR